MKFKDLVFKQHMALGETEESAKEVIALVPDFKGSKQAIYTNGYITISVLIGKMFYSNGIDTYEVMSTKDEEPTGYLSKQEVEDHINNLIVKDFKLNGTK